MEAHVRNNSKWMMREVDNLDNDKLDIRIICFIKRLLTKGHEEFTVRIKTKLISIVFNSFTFHYFTFIWCSMVVMFWCLNKSMDSKINDSFWKLYGLLFARFKQRLAINLYPSSSMDVHITSSIDVYLTSKKNVTKTFTVRPFSDGHTTLSVDIT